MQHRTWKRARTTFRNASLRIRRDEPGVKTKKKMAIIKKVKGKSPVWGRGCWFADNAAILGDVTMGEDCNIWFGAVVRGDVHYIKMGNKVNIQDNATLHTTYQKHPLNIGNHVSIAHNAVVHGCTLGDYTLVGMGAVVMDGAVVEPHSLVAAGAVVTQGTVVPSGTIYAGNPARKLKDITPEQLRDIVERISNDYAMYASWYTEESPEGEKNNTPSEQ